LAGVLTELSAKDANVTTTPTPPTRVADVVSRLAVHRYERCDTYEKELSRESSSL
jgi:hypothetical protein